MKSWRIAVWRNTELHLHPSVLVLILYAALTGHLALILISFASIFVHECAHAAVAHMCGMPLRSVELTPLGAILKTRDTDTLPAVKQFLILFAGPFTSWLLCLLALRLSKSLLLQGFSWLLFSSNLAILVMNLLPAYPLDGGRLLALMLSLFFPHRTVTRTMQCIGVTTGCILILLNVYCSWQLGGWNLSLALTGCCLLYSSYAETRTLAMTELRNFLDRKIMLESKHSMRVSVRYVLSNVQLKDVIRRLPAHRMALYCLIEPGSMKFAGCLTEMELIQNYLRSPSSTMREASEMSHNRMHTSKYDTI